MRGAGTQAGGIKDGQGAARDEDGLRGVPKGRSGAGREVSAIAPALTVDN